MQTILPTRRIFLFGLLAILVICVAILGLSPTVSYAQGGRTPRPTRTVRPTRTAVPSRTPLSGATATALNQKLDALSITATALSQSSAKISGTATALQLAQTATALVGKVTPLPSDEASASIISYAQQVLGVNVVVESARGSAGDVTRGIPNADQAQQAVARLAVKSYYGTLTDGAASLSYGVGTISGDLAVDVQGASLGIYTLTVPGTAPDANAALQVALNTYPLLTAFTYTPSVVFTGYAWFASGTATAYDPQTRTVKTIAQSIYLYVLPTQRGVTVSAVVGRGEFASHVLAK